MAGQIHRIAHPPQRFGTEPKTLIDGTQLMLHRMSDGLLDYNNNEGGGIVCDGQDRDVESDELIQSRRQQRSSFQQAVKEDIF